MTVDDVLSRHRALDKRIAEQAIMWCNLLLEEGIIQGFGRKCKMQSQTWTYEIVQKAKYEGEDKIAVAQRIAGKEVFRTEEDGKLEVADVLEMEHEAVVKAGGHKNVEVQIRPFLKA